MNLRPIRSIAFAGAAMVAFTFTSCAEKQQEATDTAQNQHEGMDHGDNTVPAKVVVETPAYTSVAAPFKRHVSELVEAYMPLKDALVASDAEAAQNAANSVLASANAMPVATLMAPDQKQFAEEQLAAVKEAASAMAGVRDVAAQRNRLESLSTAVFSLAKAFEATEETLYYQHCPMAQNNQGAYWLSSSEEIRNPYYGEKMLKCGSNEEVYKN